MVLQQQQKANILKYFSQSPDLNPTEPLWNDRMCKVYRKLSLSKKLMSHKAPLGGL